MLRFPLSESEFSAEPSPKPSLACCYHDAGAKVWQNNPSPSRTDKHQRQLFLPGASAYFPVMLLPGRGSAGLAWSDAVTEDKKLPLCARERRWEMDEGAGMSHLCHGEAGDEGQG